jgi:hypothetical protein
MFTDQLFLSGITVCWYLHVHYFSGPKLQESYYDYHGNTLQVVDVNVLTFAIRPGPAGG